jgi:hypothetical protein
VSGPAKLSAVLPAGDGNGLAAVAAELVEHPRRIRVVVALLDTSKVTTCVDDGSRIATVRVRRIEVITDPADLDAMRNLLEREFERRTGQTVLPFELEMDVRAALAEINEESTDD